jgi:hypothetical protein
VSNHLKALLLYIQDCPARAQVAMMVRLPAESEGWSVDDCYLAIHHEVGHIMEWARRARDAK